MSSEDNRTEQIRDQIAQIYESEFDRVVRYIHARMGDLPEAENLASEVFVRALRSAGAFRDTGSPLQAWIFRIARNLTIDHLRARARRPDSTELSDALHIQAEDNPETDVERLSDAETLRVAMRELTDAQREVLELRFGGQMTSREVAEVMGRSPGAVREMQSAAIKRLRTVLVRETGAEDHYAG